MVLIFSFELMFQIISFVVFPVNDDQICVYQLVDDDVLQDLEQMEKESDLDDILNYRSAAESEMQVSVL